MKASPPSDGKIVYVDGGWDMFHAGHIDLLRCVCTNHLRMCGFLKIFHRKNHAKPFIPTPFTDKLANTETTS